MRKTVCYKRNLLVFLGLGVAVQATLSPLSGQMPAFSINPASMEVAINPGTAKTVSFEVTAANAFTPERGRVILSPTDWTILESGSITYGEPGTMERSASPWMIFSPSAVTLEASRTQLVRMTVSVPANTPPGVYRTGLFVQERPPATPPDPSLQVLNVRVRYIFMLYVIVPPVAPQADLVNVEVEAGNGPLSVIIEMKNSGTRHVRPLIFWTIRPDNSAAADTAKGRMASPVLLPSATMKRSYTLDYLKLAPGRYQMSTLADFQDGNPQQSITRNFDVSAPAPPVPVQGEPPATLPDPAPSNTPIK